jgi:hypothetical protein
MRFRLILLATAVSGCLFLSLSCEDPDSLEPVSGIEGIVEYQGAWPDSIKAAALIVLTGLDERHLTDYLVTYSTPDLPGAEESDFFFQLEDGVYFVAAVGLLMDPVLFFANFDSIIAAGDLPLTILNKSPEIQFPVTIRGKKVIRSDQIITF